MTRTDSVASSGLRKAGATSLGRGSSAWRRLSVVPIALALAAVLLAPTTALAAESTSGYSQTVPTPKTTPTATSTTPTTPSTTPTSGTAPSKEEKEKAEKATPSKETSPTSTTSASKSGTLPFTGFDLSWVLAGGVLLTCAGFSLLLIERRQRRRSGR